MVLHNPGTGTKVWVPGKYQFLLEHFLCRRIPPPTNNEFQDTPSPNSGIDQAKAGTHYFVEINGGMEVEVTERDIRKLDQQEGAATPDAGFSF